MSDIEKPISVYVCRDATGEVCFVGRTRDVKRRAAEHAARGWTISRTLRTDANAARNVEQALINRLGGPTNDEQNRPR